MTVGEWKNLNHTGYTTEWAADTLGGFGKKGWPAYGNCDDCEVIREEVAPGGIPKLVIWFTRLWGPCPAEEVSECRD